MISEALSAERRRLGELLAEVLDGAAKEALTQLLVRDDTLSELAALKQDAKDFGWRQMAREREKRARLELLYRIAKTLLPKLAISQQNLHYYASLAKGVFATAQRPLAECPEATLPKRLRPYLLAFDADGKPTGVHADRYEFWIYRQLRKRLKSGEIYLDDSLQHRCLTDELVCLEEKANVLSQMAICVHPLEKLKIRGKLIF